MGIPRPTDRGTVLLEQRPEHLEARPHHQFEELGFRVDQKLIGEVTTLHPVLKAAVDAIIHDMKGKGWDAAIGSGTRSYEEQDALFAKGRLPLKEVNAGLKAVQLPPVTAKDNKVVTYARGGKSNHNKVHSLLPRGADAVDVAVGYAVDIVDKYRGWHPASETFWTDLR